MDLRPLSPALTVTGQIQPQDVATLAGAGFKSIICNRPDGEEPGQPPQATIAAAAAKAGLGFAFLPVTGADLGPAAGREFARLMATLPGPVLAYCRSGARSHALSTLAPAQA